MRCGSTAGIHASQAACWVARVLATAAALAGGLVLSWLISTASASAEPIPPTPDIHSLLKDTGVRNIVDSAQRSDVAAVGKDIVGTVEKTVSQLTRTVPRKPAPVIARRPQPVVQPKGPAIAERPAKSTDRAAEKATATSTAVKRPVHATNAAPQATAPVKSTARHTIHRASAPVHFNLGPKTKRAPSIPTSPGVFLWQSGSAQGGLQAPARLSEPTPVAIPARPGDTSCPANTNARPGYDPD
ncbi:hypothetical protein [Amycolatopsis sp. NPDC004079]|uniref:hypothetical protein n=1 Tax=Amycolatopsis sp. NPDC004079 TaxID=3154549 RepID=UPI0033AA9AB6